MNQFIWGGSAIAAATVALFFLKFWRQTRDRLFALFSLAFLTLAANWALLGILDVRNESRNVAYVLRLLAFVLIVVAIVDKNRRTARMR
jgi:hypothetical protein